MIILGIDFSLNSTGVCVLNTETNEYQVNALKPFKRIQGKRKNATKKVSLKDDERLVWIEKQIIYLLDNNPDIALAILEGYSYGKQMMSKLAEIGEGKGLWKKELKKRDIPLIIVPPQQLKKFALGAGKGGKDSHYALQIHKLWRDRGYGDCDGFDTDDEIDGFLLSVLGQYLFKDSADMMKYQQQVIKAVKEKNEELLSPFFSD
jgi:Holliday junction resolvasome RuvABC endonuclease subunit